MFRTTSYKDNGTQANVHLPALPLPNFPAETSHDQVTWIKRMILGISNLHLGGD